MRRDQHGCAVLGRHFGEDGKQCQSLRKIESGKGFVQQQQFRARRHNCGQSYPVLFSETKGERRPPCQVAYAAKCERFGDDLPGLAGGRSQASPG